MLRTQSGAFDCAIDDTMTAHLVKTEGCTRDQIFSAYISEVCREDEPDALQAADLFTAAHPDALVVATANLFYFKWYPGHIRPKDTLDVIFNLSADVLFVQEIPATKIDGAPGGPYGAGFPPEEDFAECVSAISAATANSPRTFIYGPTGEGKGEAKIYGLSFGNAVICKAGIEVCASKVVRQLLTPIGGNDGRGVVMVLIIARGKPCIVASTHLPVGQPQSHKRGERQRDVFCKVLDAIDEFAAEHGAVGVPIIFGGDFNENHINSLSPLAQAHSKKNPFLCPEVDLYKEATARGYTWAQEETEEDCWTAWNFAAIDDIAAKNCCIAGVVPLAPKHEGGIFSDHRILMAAIEF